MFQIQPYSPIPVYEQIVAQTEQFVLNGVLPEGSQMPSVRSLSMQLSVNPNTIQKAYNELDARGVLCSVPGKGCFIVEGARASVARNSRKRLAELEDIVRELAAAGVPLAEILQCAEKAHKEGLDK